MSGTKIKLLDNVISMSKKLRLMIDSGEVQNEFPPQRRRVQVKLETSEQVASDKETSEPYTAENLNNWTSSSCPPINVWRKRLSSLALNRYWNLDEPQPGQESLYHEQRATIRLTLIFNVTRCFTSGPVVDAVTSYDITKNDMICHIQRDRENTFKL